MQCSFDFFGDVCGRMLIFRSFFGRALSRNAFKSANSVADIPQKVKKTSGDIVILLEYTTVGQNRFSGPIFVDRLRTLASLGRCGALKRSGRALGSVRGARRGPVSLQTPDQAPQRTLCYSNSCPWRPRQGSTWLKRLNLACGGCGIS